MVLPALIGAGGAIASGLMGANAQGAANRTNERINLVNAMVQTMGRQDANRQALTQYLDSMEGSTDAQGNRVMYVPGKGWVTFASSTGQQQQAGQDREILNRLFQDLPDERKTRQRTYGRQIDDAHIERMLMDEFMDAREDPEAMRRRLMADANQGIQGSFDEATSAAMRTALRQGASNVPAILSGLARERAEATGEAFKSAGIQARQGAEDITMQRRGNLGNLIQAFGQRASATPGVPFQPMNTDNGASQRMVQGQKLTQGAGNNLTRALMQPTARLDYVNPNMGFANTVAQGAQGIGGVFASHQNNKRHDELMKRLNQGSGF